MTRVPNPPPGNVVKPPPPPAPPPRRSNVNLVVHHLPPLRRPIRVGTDFCMYHFKCGSYGEELTVMARSIGEAVGYLENYRDTPDEDNVERYRQELVNKVLRGDGYTVEVYSPGEVLMTEVS